MARGASPGENRFKSAQKALMEYRLARLNDVVVPKLKALSTHTSVNSINKFCNLAAGIYNEDLPINERPISYRRLNQSELYWNIIGTVYHRHFEKKQNLEDFKKSSSRAFNNQQVVKLEHQIERLKAENKTLRLSLSGLPSKNEKASDSDGLERSQQDIENLARIIELLIAKYGVVEIDFNGVALRDLADDLEAPEGMLPRDVVEPFIRWLSNKKAKLDSNMKISM